jgi:hypothetical protein
MNTGAEVRLTRPSWGVVGLLLVYGFFTALLAAAAVAHGSPLALIPIIAFTSVLAQYGWRWARMTVIADGTGLTIRNSGSALEVKHPYGLPIRWRRAVVARHKARSRTA